MSSEKFSAQPSAGVDIYTLSPNIPSVKVSAAFTACQCQCQVSTTDDQQLEPLRLLCALQLLYFTVSYTYGRAGSFPSIVVDNIIISPAHERVSLFFVCFFCPVVHDGVCTCRELGFMCRTRFDVFHFPWILYFCCRPIKYGLLVMVYSAALHFH